MKSDSVSAINDILVKNEVGEEEIFKEFIVGRSIKGWLQICPYERPGLFTFSPNTTSTRTLMNNVTNQINQKFMSYCAKSNNRGIEPIGFNTNEEMEKYIIEGKDNGSFLFGILFKDKEEWMKNKFPKKLNYAFRPAAIPRYNTC